MAISIGRVVAVSYRETDLLFNSTSTDIDDSNNRNTTNCISKLNSSSLLIKTSGKVHYSTKVKCNVNNHNSKKSNNKKSNTSTHSNNNRSSSRKKKRYQQIKLNYCCCLNCNLKLSGDYHKLADHLKGNKRKIKYTSTNSKIHNNPAQLHKKTITTRKGIDKYINKINNNNFNTIINKKPKIKFGNNSKERCNSFNSNKEIEQAFEALTMNEIVKNGINGPIMTSSGDKREHLYKILIIGELGTGKTSFIKRYVHKFFSQNYRATIGVDFALKVLHWDQNTIIRLQLWDIAGQERFGNMTRVYYKDAVGAFIVFDVTRSGTFECVSKWKEDLDSKVQLPDGSPIPCILLANKCDQEKQGLVTNPEKMDEYVKENGFAGWFETSAKENINIDEAARALVNKILLNDKLISAADLDADKIDLQGSSGYGGSGGKKRDCAC